MEALAYAAEAAPAGGVQSILGNPLVVMIPIFVIMYMLLIRPQKKKQDQHKEMLKNLKKGDKVITSSGLYGIVVKVSEKDVILEVADKMNLRFSIGAIGNVREREEKKEAD